MSLVELRHDFDIDYDDVQYLQWRGLLWETLREGKSQWLIIHEFPLPDGYNVASASVAFLIPGDYLTIGLDMAYFCPTLSRSDGVPIGATNATVTIQSKTYQRWSRHRTGSNPWRPGIDNLATHVGLVEEWLKREFT